MTIKENEIFECEDCTYYETQTGYKYRVKYCDTCNKNAALIIVENIINVQALLNTYTKIGEQIRKNRIELKMFNKEQNES